jgi:hypothetical protein
MARPSKIDKLPAPLRELIGALRQGGATIDQIMAKLQELKPDLDISRTGLGEHVQKLDKIAEKMRESRAVAEALVKQFGEEQDNRTSRINIELMHAVVMKLLAGDATLEPAEVMFLAKSLQSLSAANKADIEAAARLRKEFAEKTVKAAEKAIDASGAPDKEALLKKIREEIYGIV